MEKTKEQLSNAQASELKAVAQKSPLPVRVAWHAAVFAVLARDCVELDWEPESCCWRCSWPPAVVELATGPHDLRPDDTRCWLFVCAGGLQTGVHALWWRDAEGPLYFLRPGQVRGALKRMHQPPDAPITNVYLRAPHLRETTAPRVYVGNLDTRLWP